MPYVVVALPALVVIIRWLIPMTLPTIAFIATATLVIASSEFIFWSRLSSGSPLAPEFPRPVVIAFNWAFGTIFFLSILQLAIDAGTLVASSVWPNPITVPAEVRYLAAGIAAILALLAVANAVRLPSVKKVDVIVSNLPPTFEGYRVLQLTDLHISRLFDAKWATAVVEKANAVGADIIVITGDFADGGVDMRRADVAPLRHLHAPDGIFGVPGNHEYIFDYKAWLEQLQRLGITMLLNSHKVLRRGTDTLVLAGVTDSSATVHGEVGPSLTSALDAAPNDAPIILLDHQPRNARDAAAQRVALQLSGHTHGGLFVGLGLLSAKPNGGFVSGAYNVDGMALYVSNGTGLWPGAALRLGRPSELTLITLHRFPRRQPNN